MLKCNRCGAEHSRHDTTVPDSTNVFEMHFKTSFIEGGLRKEIFSDLCGDCCTKLEGVIAGYIKPLPLPAGQ